MSVVADTVEPCPLQPSKPSTWSSGSASDTAVDGVSFAVPPGTVLGLLGPNGAGKTTTVRMMTTLTEPTSGTARVAGYDVRDRARPGAPPHGPDRSGRHRRRTAHRPREHPDDRRPLRHPAQGPRAGSETNCCNSSRSPTPPTAWSSPIPGACGAGWISRSACWPRRRCCSSTSRPPGWTRAAAASCGTCCAVWSPQGTTLLLTTQYLEEADQLADNIVVIDRGRIIAQGSPLQLKQQAGSASLVVTVADAADLPRPGRCSAGPAPRCSSTPARAS